METTDNKKEMIFLRIYSILILIYSVFDIVTAILPKFFAIPINPNTAFVNYFFTLTGIALYTTPINMIVGYGLLLRRYWARYGAIAVMLTFPVEILTQFLWWGPYSLNTTLILVECLFVTLTLVYFSRRSVNALFGQTTSFRLISWHGLFVIIIMLISFSWIMISVYWKVHAAWKFGYPFFTDRPQAVALEKPRTSEIFKKYRKVELLNVSLLIPKDFSIARLNRIKRKNQKWVVSLQNQGVNTKAFMNLGNDFIYDELLDKPIGKMLRSNSKFDFEKFILTNNWNPGLVAVRSLMRPKGGEGFHVKEIHTDDLRGFLKEWQKGDAFFREFSLYNREDTQCIAGSIMSIKGYLDEKDILTTLSSIEFLKPEGPDQAKNHYEKGLVLYKQGDILQARVEFANAYMLSLKNPDTIFMFAKSLSSKELENYNTMKDLLNEVLKLKPDHKDAKKLLKEIEAKLPKGTKK